MIFVSITQNLGPCRRAVLSIVLEEDNNVFRKFFLSSKYIDQRRSFFCTESLVGGFFFNAWRVVQRIVTLLGYCYWANCWKLLNGKLFPGNLLSHVTELSFWEVCEADEWITVLFLQKSKSSMSSAEQILSTLNRTRTRGARGEYFWLSCAGHFDPGLFLAASFVRGHISINGSSIKAD
jgi:hypothetical protein